MKDGSLDAIMTTLRSDIITGGGIGAGAGAGVVTNGVIDRRGEDGMTKVIGQGGMKETGTTTQEDEAVINAPPTEKTTTSDARDAITETTGAAVTAPTGTSPETMTEGGAVQGHAIGNGVEVRHTADPGARRGIVIELLMT